MFVLNKYRVGREMVEVYPNVFDAICQRVGSGEPCSFSRFGDAEFAAMLAVEDPTERGSSNPFPTSKEAMVYFELEPRTMDGHEFFPDLGIRLRQIVDSKPDYLMGLGLAARLLFGEFWIKSRLPRTRHIDWVSANSFVTALITGTFSRLFDALCGKQVILVGPPHLEKLAVGQSWAYVEVKRQNCWTDYSVVKNQLEALAAAEQNAVFLFCATMMSNVLIDDLYRLNPANTHLDIGSAFDPYAGVNSRRFHSALNLEAPSPPPLT